MHDRAVTPLAHVEIEIAILIVVAEGHGRAQERQRGGQCCTARHGDIAKARALVEEEMMREPAEHADVEIEIAIAIDVAKRRACGGLIEGEALCRRHIGEVPSAIVLVERGGAIDARDDEVLMAIAIRIAHRRACQPPLGIAVISRARRDQHWMGEANKAHGSSVGRLHRARGSRRSRGEPVSVRLVPVSVRLLRASVRLLQASGRLLQASRRLLRASRRLLRASGRLLQASGRLLRAFRRLLQAFVRAI